MKGARHRIAVIAGDGIGNEVMPAAIRAIDALLAGTDNTIDWESFDWGSDYYRRHGRMMPVDGLDAVREHSAIFFGAVGDPEVSDVETLWGLLIPFRREFDQYINLRPVVTIEGVRDRLREGERIDAVIVRENTEGEYSNVGGRSHLGLPTEAAYQQAIFTRHGIERVTRYAADLSRRRSGQLVSATKSNGIIHSMTYWDSVVAETLCEYPDVSSTSVLIDALAAKVILAPSSLDVIVASNLFGDILADALAAMAGSIGIAPSANINPERRHPSLFEPVHGSAPDIAGKGIANPIGQIWSGAMMLEHLGLAEHADRLMEAVRVVTASGVSTPDLGGTDTTESVTDAIIAAL